MKKSELKEMIKAEMMAEVQYDIDDTNSDYDFLTEKYVETPYEKLLTPAVISMVALRNYVETAAPEYLDDIKSAIEALMKFDDKMTYGDDEEYSDDDLGVPGDNALGLEENRSEFDTNKPTRIESFLRELDDLVDEYHAELYLNDELFAAMNDVKSAAKLEMGREDEMDYSDDDLGVPGDNALGLEEAEEEVDAEEVDVKVGDEEFETTDVEMTDKVDPNVKAVQDALTAAQAAASDLGDEKLTDQIGNTITFFTRQHVANIDSMNESQNRMLKLAGLLK